MLTPHNQAHIEKIFKNYRGISLLFVTQKNPLELLFPGIFLKYWALDFCKHPQSFSRQGFTGLGGELSFFLCQPSTKSVKAKFSKTKTNSLEFSTRNANITNFPNKQDECRFSNIKQKW